MNTSYKCKYCANLLPQYTPVCPLCNKRQSALTPRVYVSAFSLLILLIIIGVVLDMGNQSLPQRREPKATDQEILKATDQELWHKLNAAMSQEKLNWEIKTLQIIEELLKRNNVQLKQPDFMDQFTAVVLEHVDLKGNWSEENSEISILLERIIKQMDSTILMTSFGKVLKGPHVYIASEALRSDSPVICGSCEKMLALSANLSLPGYETYFLSIMSDMADPSTAALFFYSKNRALSDASKKWIEKNPKAIDNLVYNGANCLNDEADWIDRGNGRRIYDILDSIDNAAVVNSLARHIMKPANRRRVLYLAVKLGKSGTEERLNKILANHGDKNMAEDFLNSGSEKLRDGGTHWAKAHGYSITAIAGSPRISWGSF